MVVKVGLGKIVTLQAFICDTKRGDNTVHIAIIQYGLTIGRGYFGKLDFKIRINLFGNAIGKSYLKAFKFARYRIFEGKPPDRG